MLILVAGLATAAAARPPLAQAADPVVVSFASTGEEQTFVVPSGVTTVHVVAIGGRGAPGVLSQPGLLVSAQRRYERLGWLQYVAECYEIAAFAAERRGRTVEALRLIGAADQARERSGNAATLAIAKRRDETLPRMRAAVGDHEYAAALVAGRALTGEQALIEAEQLLPA